MKSKLLIACVCVSAICFFIFAALFIYVRIANSDPRIDESGIHWSYISLGDDFHIAATKSWGGNLVFFDQVEPYTGGVVSFVGDKSVKVSGWDGGGIYFRHITHTVRTDWDQWTLIISLWYPVIIFAILPLTITVKKWRAIGKLTTGRTTT